MLVKELACYQACTCGCEHCRYAIQDEYDECDDKACSGWSDDTVRHNG